MAVWVVSVSLFLIRFLLQQNLSVLTMSYGDHRVENPFPTHANKHKLSKRPFNIHERIYSLQQMKASTGSTFSPCNKPPTTNINKLAHKLLQTRTCQIQRENLYLMPPTKAVDTFWTSYTTPFRTCTISMLSMT